MHPEYLIPLAPIAGFLLALAVGYAAASYLEYRAIRVRKGERR